MRSAAIVAGGLLGLCALPGAGAAERNDLLSCREQLLHESSAPRRDYFIVVDRTVVLSPDLVDKSIKLAESPIRPGDHVEVLSFSGLTATEFTEVQLNMRFDVPFTEVELNSKIPARLRPAAEHCNKEQLPLGVSKIHRKLSELLGTPLRKARRSEILYSLTTISRDAIQPGGSADKLVLLISDMLEYSDVASFYGPRSLRVQEPGKVLAVAHKQGLMGTFGQARIYVQGAAAVSDPRVARGLKEREALRAFWEQWFRESGGNLVGWGDPAFLGEIH